MRVFSERFFVPKLFCHAGASEVLEILGGLFQEMLYCHETNYQSGDLVCRLTSHWRTT